MWSVDNLIRHSDPNHRHSVDLRKGVNLIRQIKNEAKDWSYSNTHHSDCFDPCQSKGKLTLKRRLSKKNPPNLEVLQNFKQSLKDNGGDSYNSTCKFDTCAPGGATCLYVQTEPEIRCDCCQDLKCTPSQPGIPGHYWSCQDPNDLV